MSIILGWKGMNTTVIAQLLEHILFNLLKVVLWHLQGCVQQVEGMEQEEWVFLVLVELRIAGIIRFGTQVTKIQITNGSPTGTKGHQGSPRVTNG